MKLTLALHCDGPECPNAIHATTSTRLIATANATTRLLALAIQQHWDIRPVELDNGAREETRAHCPPCASRLHTQAAAQALGRMAEPDHCQGKPTDQ